MRSLLGAIVALSASFVAAQDASNLPQCSLPCFIQYVPETGCQVTDYACQCTTEHQNQIRNDITSCVMQKCTDQQDQLNTLSVTNAICAKYGPPSSSGGAPAPTGDSSNSSSSSSGGSLGGLSGSGTTTSSSSSIVMGVQATYFTAAAQPLQTAGALAGAAVAAAAIVVL